VTRVRIPVSPPFLCKKASYAKIHPMKQSLKDFLKFAAFPIGMFVFLGLFLMVWTWVGLPSFAEIVTYAEAKYETHGYWVVFIAALAEGVLLLNWYLPGSVVSVMGVLFAIEGNQSVVLTVGLISLALFIMTITNYFLGKYGWYRLLAKFGLEGEIQNVKGRILKHGLKYMLLGYFHPHTASLIATAAGILQMKFRRFLLYTFVAYLFWMGVWLGVAYTFGAEFLALINFQNLLILVGLWVVVMGLQFLWKQRKKRRMGGDGAGLEEVVGEAVGNVE